MSRPERLPLFFNWDDHYELKLINFKDYCESPYKDQSFANDSEIPLPKFGSPMPFWETWIQRLDALIVQIPILISPTTGFMALNNYLFAALNCDPISHSDSSDNPPAWRKSEDYVQDTRATLRDVVIGLIA